MPPVIILVAGAIGAVAAAKWAMREAARINAELHPERHGGADATKAPERGGRLRRDASGVYRPD